MPCEFVVTRTVNALWRWSELGEAAGGADLEGGVAAAATLGGGPDALLSGALPRLEEQVRPRPHVRTVVKSVAAL